MYRRVRTSTGPSTARAPTPFCRAGGKAARKSGSVTSGSPCRYSRSARKPPPGFRCTMPRSRVTFVAPWRAVTFSSSTVPFSYRTLPCRSLSAYLKNFGVTRQLERHDGQGDFRQQAPCPRPGRCCRLPSKSMAPSGLERRPDALHFLLEQRLFQMSSRRTSAAGDGDLDVFLAVGFAPRPSPREEGAGAVAALEVAKLPVIRLDVEDARHLFQKVRERLVLHRGVVKLDDVAVFIMAPVVCRGVAVPVAVDPEIGLSRRVEGSGQRVVLGVR